jgi:flagellar motor switch protein FliG
MTDPDVLRHAIERLIEDVSLTADLVDDAAKVLLDWGTAQAKAVIQQENGLSTEELGARLADLRRTLKHVSKEAGQAVPEAQAAQVQTLLSEITPETQAAQTLASLSEVMPEAQATQIPTSLSEALPEKEEPEVDEWRASRRDRYHLS